VGWSSAQQLRFSATGYGGSSGAQILISMNKAFFLLVLCGALYGATPTTITIVNPNSVSVTVKTSTGDLDTGNVVNNAWVVAANATRVVSHVDDGDWVGFSISVSQVVTNAAGIVSATPTPQTNMTYIRNGGDSEINLPNGYIGTPFLVTAAAAASVVWNPTSISGIGYQYNTSSTDGLQGPVTQELFREGVEKIVNAAGGGGGGAGSPHTEALSAGQAATLDASEVGTATPTIAARSAAATAAGTSVNSALGAASATAKGYTITSSDSVPSAFAIALPERMGGITFDLNPFREDRLGGVISWFRTACNWLCVAALGAWVWKQFADWIKALNVTRQAQGNAVAAGTGAQATAFAAAGLIFAVILGAFAALAGYAFDGMNFASLLGPVTTNPLVAMGSGAFWMLDKCLPVATLITAFVAKLAFERFATGIFAVAATVIRFITP